MNAHIKWFSIIMLLLHYGFASDCLADESDGRLSVYRYRLAISKSKLLAAPKWDVLSTTQCPVSVEIAIQKSAVALRKMCAECRIEDVEVTCVLQKARQAYLADGESANGLGPQARFWIVRYYYLPPVGNSTSLIVDLPFAVLLDGSVVLPHKVQEANE